MDLNISNIILGPVLTDKAYKLNQKKQLVLRVHPNANKAQIKQVIETAFDVKVARVNVAIRKGKTTTFKRLVSTKPKRKIAYITLKEGYSLNIFDTDQTAAASVSESAVAPEASQQ